MAKSILLVDDDAHILETACDILEAAGYDVRTAESGATAMAALGERAADLMIVDFNLLDTTGVELTLKVKKLYPAIAVILMTGEANVDAGPAKSLVKAILTKPVNPPDLMDLIQKAL